MSDVSLMPYREWTVEDLDDTPDDGRRYELVDGVLLVSAAPSLLHQLLLTNLVVLMANNCPAPMRTLVAPVDVRLSRTRQLQPDLLVVPELDLRGTAQRPLPLLVVEVLSPSTRAVDLTLKRHVFEQGGVPSYWVLDPLVPSLTVLELRNGGYVEVASVTGAEAYDAVLPFPVTIVPADLLR